MKIQKKGLTLKQQWKTCCVKNCQVLFAICFKCQIGQLKITTTKTEQTKKKSTKKKFPTAYEMKTELKTLSL